MHHRSVYANDVRCDTLTSDVGKIEGCVWRMNYTLSVIIWYDVRNEPDALRSSILIVNKANLVTYHFTDPLKVFAVKVDFDLTKIYPPTPFQRLLKFGNWEEPTDDQKMMYLQLLDSKFSDKDIIEKIILPLATAHLE